MPVDDAATATAIRRQEERLQRDPTSLAFAQLADLYRKVGRSREAIHLCREGLARYPHYTTARLILAKALLTEGELDPALAELTVILAASPQDLQSHRLAAEIHRRCGRIDAAVEHLQTAARLDPGDRESRAVLGVLRPEGRAGEEADGLGRLLADDTFVTVAFGRACLDQGLADEAAQVFGRILRQHPDNAEARAGLEQALRARLRRKG
jgi:tetratricopeptide (TPR) repeat protein